MGLLDGKVAIVTGAGGGLGEAYAKLFAKEGASVVVNDLGGTRDGSGADRSAAQKVVDEIEAAGGKAVANGDDVSTVQGGENILKSALDTYGKIDILVCNAGILSKESLGDIDEDGFAAMRRQFEVNSLGPLRTVQALSGNLAKGAKVGIVTSRMGSVADNTSGGYYGYRASKAAVNAIGKSLAMDLKDRGIAVLLLHPGYVATEMVGGSGDIGPEDAAAQLVQRLDQLTLAQTGSFRHAKGDELPW